MNPGEYQGFNGMLTGIFDGISIYHTIYMYISSSIVKNWMIYIRGWSSPSFSEGKI